MKKIFLVFFFLIFCIFAGIAGFIMHSFNTENFKNQVITSVNKLTGREFNVMGSTYVSWFPTPRIILHDVTLSNMKGSNRSLMLRAEKVGINMDWQALLKTPLVIKKIHLEKPSLYLERNASNKVNWDFPFLFQSGSDIDADPLNASQNFAQTRVESLQIEQGLIEYTDADTTAKTQLSNITGDLSLGSLRGPYVFEGDFSLLGRTFNTELNVEQYHINTPIPFTANILQDNRAITLELSGEIIPDQKSGTTISASGPFSIQRPNELLNLFGLKPLHPSLNIPASGSFTYEIGNRNTALKSIIVRFGSSEDSIALTGSIERNNASRTPSYTASLAINTLDYNHWEDFISSVNPEELYNPQQPDFDLKLDMQKAIYADQEASAVSIDVSKKGDRFIIQSASAVLPGETQIKAEGGTFVQNHETAFLINFNATAKDAQPILSKYIDTKNVNSSLLKNASFTGSATIWPNKKELLINNLTLAQSTITGNFSVENTDKKEKIATNLDIKNINFDEFSSYKKEEKPLNISAFPALLKKVAQEATLFNNKDADIKLNLSDVTWHQLPIRKGSVTAKVKDDTFSLSQLKLQDTATADIIASAEIENLGKKEAKIKNIKLDFAAKQFNLFASRANISVPNNWLQKAGQTNIFLQAGEDNNIWTINSKNTIAPLDFTINGSVNLQELKPNLKDLQVSLHYPSLKKFLNEVLETKRLDTSLDGPLSLQTTLNGTDDNLRFTDTEVQVSPHKLSVSGEKSIINNKINLSMKIKTPRFEVEKYLPNAFKPFVNKAQKGQSFNFDDLEDIQGKILLTTDELIFKDTQLNQVNLTLSKQDKSISLDDMKATLTESERQNITLTGKISWEETPNLKATIAFEDSTLPDNFITGNKISFGTGVFSVHANIATQGSSFADWEKNLSGKGNITLENALFIGADLNRIPHLISQTIKDKETKSYFDTALTRTLNSGKTNITEISGPFTIQEGIIKMMNLSLKADTVYSNPMQVSYNVATEDLAVSVPFSIEEYPDLPPFALSIKGPFKNPVYYQNSVDLSNSVIDLIEKDAIKEAKAQQQEKEEQARTTLTKRQEKIQEAIKQAQTAIDAADAKLFAGDNKSANFLLQNAKDALNVVNKLSIKENLTDAEYIQLMEQSRLAVLKANEAINEAEKDKFFENRKTLATFIKKSQNMITQVESVHETNPDIKIVSKLIVAMNKYLAKLEESAKLANQKTTSTDEQEQIIEDATVNYQKIVKAYNYASRFNSDMKPVTVDESQAVLAPRSVSDMRQTQTEEATPATTLEKTQLESFEAGSNLRGNIIRRKGI